MLLSLVVYLGLVCLQEIMQYETPVLLAWDLLN